MKVLKHIAVLLFIIAAIPVSAQQDPAKAGRSIWTPEQAKAWYNKQPWLVGANFLPSTAINELEMWQAETFDTATIAREL